MTLDVNLCSHAGCDLMLSPSGRRCDIGHDNPAPNVRRAKAARTSLLDAAKNAERGLRSRGVDFRRIDAIKQAIDCGSVVFSAAPNVFLTMLERNGAYSNYYKLREARIIAEWSPDRARGRLQTDAWLFPGYHDSITFGCIVPNDNGKCITDGPTAYGQCTAFVKPAVHSYRTSLFVGDSLHYYTRFSDDHNPAREGPPPIATSTWEDRIALALIKVSETLNNSVPMDGLEQLVFVPGGEKSESDFIEAHIHDPIEVGALLGIRLSAPLTDSGSQFYWRTLESTAKGCSLSISVAKHAKF